MNSMHVELNVGTQAKCQMTHYKDLEFQNRIVMMKMDIYIMIRERKICQW